jgi:Fur family transcriptional regulator, peroxide stress response regulator
VSQRISAANLKVTPQRMAIYAQLLSRDDHPSPESLYLSVKDDLPRLSLATVYKTLDALQAAGLVLQLAIPNEAKRYDANLKPHHHLICTQCRCIIDSTDALLAPLRTQKSKTGFRANEIKVQILGVCASCQNEAQAHQSDVEDKMSFAIKTTMEEEQWLV